MRPTRERFTIGVEEEYHLVERESGELRSRSEVVRAADRTGTLEGEIQETMVEIGTPICTTIDEIAVRLRERRFQAAAAAAVEDLDVLASGTHPFARWRDQRMTEGDRPKLLSAIFRQVLREQIICGMHIHVAVPEEFDRVLLMNQVRAFTPHLLALSCSSPFQEGEDTGFASFRAIYWRRFPFTGAPPRFGSTEEYNEFLSVLLRAGMIPDERTVYWSVRPSARFPTLELRVCDVCPNLQDALAIAALARGLVVAAAKGDLDPIGSSLSPSLQDEVVAENEWLAARDGLDGVLLAPESPAGKQPMREAIADLLGVLRPTLESLGDGAAIEGARRILENGNAADRMRERFARFGSMSGLVEWLVDETRLGTGIDRRSRTRN